jgi:hypothetical protein
VAALAPWNPYWVEEPTSPDEILGLAAIKAAIAPVKVAVGEHVANRVIFKQILQAGAADVLTIDACRVAGVNENLAILLLAAKFGVLVFAGVSGRGGRSRPRVRRSPARALHGPGPPRRRPVPRADRTGLLRDAPAPVTARLRVPARRRLAAALE